MGKRHQHKKNLKAEKAKVKLKNNNKAKTKFLPKGQNITKVDFKVKSIVLREQLSEQSNLTSPSSKRKLSIKELVKHLKHHSDHAKIKACEDLDALTKADPDSFKIETPDLLKNVCDLFQEDDQKVRKAAAKAIDSIMSVCTEDVIATYLDSVILNLECAMLNINRSAKEDSLLLFDALLKHAPSQLAKESISVLPLLISLISKAKSEAGPSRTVTMGLENKMVINQWRMKVLTRLSGILGAMVTQLEEEEAKRVRRAILRPRGPLLNRVFCGIVDIYKDECPVSPVHLACLIPVLHEIWTESLPDSYGKNSTENIVLKQETAAILCCILRILHNCYTYAGMKKKDVMNLVSIFGTKEARKFITSIIKYFPYRQDVRKSSKDLKEIKKYLELSQDGNCVRENLLVCSLYIKISKQNSINADLSSVINYIITCLTTPYFIKANNMDLFFSILKLILVENTKWIQGRHVNVQEILGYTCKYYKNVNSLQYQTKLCKILLDVLDNSLLNQCAEYHAWLAHFPEKLMEPEIPSSIIRIVFRLTVRNVETVNSVLLANLENILNNIITGKITFDEEDNSDIQCEETRLKRQIASCYKYAPTFQVHHAQLILTFINSIDDPNWKRLFMSMLEERVKDKKTGYKELGELMNYTYWNQTLQ